MRRNNYTKKRKFVKLFVTFAAIGVVSYGASLIFKNQKTSDDFVVAKVNNEKIYKSEIDSKIREVFAGNDDSVDLPSLETFPAEVVETFAKEIYLEKELVARAKKSGVAKDEEVKRQIETSQNRIYANAYLNKLIKEKVSEEKIRDKYAELSGSFAAKKEIAVAHIVVKTKAEAEKIYDSLTAKKSKNRVSFAEAAKKHSLNKESAANGGKLGYVAEDNLDKDVAKVALSLKKGEVSKPFETKDGWQIVKFEDAKEVQGASFEDVKEKLREQLIRQETGVVYKEIFDNVKIEILLKKEESAKQENQLKTEENQDEKQQLDEEKSSQQQEASEPAAEEKSDSKSEVKSKKE